MALSAQSDTSFLMPAASQASAVSNMEPVEVVTLDEACSARRIQHVSYLKIDTEGGDLNVLKGGERLLRSQQIDFVEVEASMHTGNRRHVPFESLKEYLESHGYLLFGIYAQVPESSVGGLHLRRTNSTFISRFLIDTHTTAA